MLYLCSNILHATNGIFTIVNGYVFVTFYKIYIICYEFMTIRLLWSNDNNNIHFSKINNIIKLK